MFHKKAHVVKEVPQVPVPDHALLLAENDFVHANPARAVAHPVRHDDHVIRQKEVGLVGLHEQLELGLNLQLRPLVMRLHDAVIVVRNLKIDIVGCRWRAAAAIMLNQRVHPLRALQIIGQRFHQIEEPVLFLPERRVAVVRVNARQVLLLHPVVLRQRGFVPANGVLVSAAVPIAVGAIKGIPHVQVVAGGQRLGMRRFQQQRVLQVLVGIPVARPAAPRHHVVVAFQDANPPPFVRGRLQAGNVLVQDRVIPEALAVVDELGSGVRGIPRVGRAEFEVVLVVRHRRRQRDGAANGVVRVKHEQQVRFVVRVGQRLGAVVPEIDPLVAVQLARNVHPVAEKVLNDFSGGVGGPRVANDPVVKPYLGAEHFQRLADEVRLVLHNHVQTHGGIRHWCGIRYYF